MYNHLSERWLCNVVTFNDVDVLNLDPTESGTHPSNQTKIYHREPKKLEIKYVPKLT